MNLTPGIYKGTIRGVPDVTFLIDVDSHGAARVTPHRIDGNWWHGQDDITDARRLYTLDLDVFGATPKHIAESMRKSDNFYAEAISAQIEAQIPKPPRMDEPGWGEKVKASTKDRGGLRRRFVNSYICGGTAVWIDEAGFSAYWSDLVDPEPVQS